MNLFRFASAENRLIRKTLADTVNPNVKFNRRTAAINAGNQAAQTQAQVKANQDLIAQNPGGLDPKAPNLAPLVTVQKQPLSQNATPQFQTYDATTGVTTVAPQLGEIDQDAIIRLMASGLTEGQARQQVQGMRPVVAQTMSNTGLPSTARKSETLPPPTGPAEAALTQGGISDPVLLADARNKDAQARLLAQQAEDQKNKAAGDKAASSAASNAASAEAEATPPATPEDGGMAAAIAGLPPEYGFLGPIFQNLLGTLKQGEQQNADFTNAMLNGGQVMVNGQPVNVQGINSTYDRIDEQTAKLEAGYTKIHESIQGMLEKAKEQQETSIAEQEKAAKEKIEWDRLNAERRINKAKTDAKEAKIIEMAVKNRMGGDGAMREIQEVEAYFDNQFEELRINTGFARTDVAAKFAGLYAEAGNKYLTNTIANIKDGMAAIERVTNQDMSNTKARSDAELDELGKFFKTQSDSRKEYAKEVRGIGTDIATFINQDRDDKRAQEQLGWQRMEWASKTYGTNAPEALIRSIQTQLPNVDVAGTLSAMTLAEMKQRKVGSAGSSLAFPPSMMKSGGQPPSYEDFVNAKKAELRSNTTMSIEEARKALDPKSLKAEYEASLAATNMLNPTEIVNRLKMKAGTLDAQRRKYAESTVSDYLAAGEYQLASDFVDNTGDDIPATQAGDFTQALNARYDVMRLHEAVQKLGTTGPVTGRLRSLNPYDPEMQKVKTMVTQTVPNLARGIFKEVGVLTDSDVARYTSTLENPRLTVEQAMQTYDDLMKKVDVSMFNQIQVWDANGKRVKGVRDLYNAKPLGVDEVTLDGATQADQDYALSILMQQ